MTSYNSVFGNSLQPSVYNSFTSVGTFATPFTTNIQLAWSTQFQNGLNVVSTIMNFYPSMNGLLVTLPDATQTSVGAQFYYNNVSAFSFSFHDFAGNLVATIAAGSTGILYLTDNSSVSGVWFNVPAGGGTSAVTSIGAVAVGANSIANLTITGTPGLPITSAGTINFTFAGDLAALIGFGNLTGIAARTSANNWSLRTITAVANATTVTNGNGVGGNPTIGLAANIQNITSIEVGNILISGNTIAASAGSNLILTPQAGGVTETTLPISLRANAGNSTPLRFYNPLDSFYLSLQGGATTGNIALVLPATAPTDGQALVNTTGGQLGWETIAGLPSSSAPNAIAKFLNAGGELTDTNIFVTGASNADVTGVNTMIIQNLNLANAGASTISTTALNLGLAPITAVTDLRGSATTAATLLFHNINNVNFTALKAPPGAAGVTFVLPGADGGARALMVTDGAANLSLSNITTNYIPKGWAVFDGTGANGVKVPGDSVNITSITKTATGTYIVVVTTPFTSTNYGVSGSVSAGGGPGIVGALPSANNTFTLYTNDVTGAAFDFNPVSFQLFGRQ